MQSHQTPDAVDDTSSFIIQQKKLFIEPENNRPAVIHLVKYDHSQYDDQLYPSLKVNPPAQFDSWVSKRKAQFLCGRLAAQKSLKIDTKDKGVLIPIGRNREAIWPSGFIGSISHSNNISIATALPKSPKILGVGLDIQAVLSEQEALYVRQTVLTNSDRLFIKKSVTGLSENQLLTLIFSAKESFFKAAFTSVGEYFDFNAVKVNSVSTESQLLSLKSNISLSNEIKKDDIFKVAFNILDTPATSVITFCLLQY